MSVTLRPEFPAAPPQPVLSEADIVTADLTVDWSTLVQIAVRKATQWPKAEYAFAFHHEMRALFLLAEAVIENRKAQRDAAERAPKERLIRSIEFDLHKARHGMGGVYDLADVRRLESLLAEAKAAPANDPGVLLADRLQAAE